MWVWIAVAFILGSFFGAGIVVVLMADNGRKEE